MRTETRPEQLKHDLEDLRASMRGLRDEIKVRIHLAGMDLKDEFAKLEPRLNEAEKYAEAVSEATVRAAKDLKNDFVKLRDRLEGLRKQQQLKH